MIRQRIKWFVIWTKQNNTEELKIVKKDWQKFVQSRTTLVVFSGTV
jgi:hypothetical protein